MAPDGNVVIEIFQFLHLFITLPSLNVDLDPGGYLEDLGLILGILAIMVNSI